MQRASLVVHMADVCASAVHHTGGIRRDSSGPGVFVGMHHKPFHTSFSPRTAKVSRDAGVRHISSSASSTGRLRIASWGDRRVQPLARRLLNLKRARLPKLRLEGPISWRFWSVDDVSTARTTPQPGVCGDRSRAAVARVLMGMGRHQSLSPLRRL
jgi:hypothetical protein